MTQSGRTSAQRQGCWSRAASDVRSSTVALVSLVGVLGLRSLEELQERPSSLHPDHLTSQENAKVEEGSQQPAHTLIDNLKGTSSTTPMRMHVAHARWGPGRPSSTAKLARVRTGAPGRWTVSTTRRSVLQRRWSISQRR